MAISCCRNSEKSSFDCKLKELVLFLIVESDWRATNLSSTPTISSKASNQNFEIGVLLNVVKRSGNYAFEDDKLCL